MYEVEIKAHLKDKNKIIEKLKSLGCEFGEELHQKDYIFNPRGEKFPPTIGEPVLRVREENGKNILTLKINQTSRLDCIERELEISDGEMMKEIILLLDFREDVTVEKKRIKTKYKNIEICLDSVMRLGDFIEAEKITTENNPEIRKKIQSELMDFLLELGIEREDQVIDGKYDIMLFEKYSLE